MEDNKLGGASFTLTDLAARSPWLTNLTTIAPQTVKSVKDLMSQVDADTASVLSRFGNVALSILADVDREIASRANADTSAVTDLAKGATRLSSDLQAGDPLIGSLDGSTALNVTNFFPYSMMVYPNRAAAISALTNLSRKAQPVREAIICAAMPHTKGYGAVLDLYKSILNCSTPAAAIWYWWFLRHRCQAETQFNPEALISVNKYSTASGPFQITQSNVIAYTTGAQAARGKALGIEPTRKSFAKNPSGTGFVAIGGREGYSRQWADGEEVMKHLDILNLVCYDAIAAAKKKIIVPWLVDGKNLSKDDMQLIASIAPVAALTARVSSIFHNGPGGAPVNSEVSTQVPKVTLIFCKTLAQYLKQGGSKAGANPGRWLLAIAPGTPSSMRWYPATSFFS